jgi:ABC-type cobalamin transport system permease subunit
MQTGQIQTGLPALLFSIAVVAALLLIAGGIRMIRRNERQKALLMIGAALVLLANVLIWTLPFPAA